MTDAKIVERGQSRCENIVCTYVRTYLDLRLRKESANCMRRRIPPLQNVNCVRMRD